MHLRDRGCVRTLFVYATALGLLSLTITFVWFSPVDLTYTGWAS